MTDNNTARHATLTDLATLLQTQQTRKLDVVSSAAGFRFEGGLLHVCGQEAEITEQGVTQVDGVYRPTSVFDEGLASKLSIPLAYLRRMRAERPDLYDANANGWLRGVIDDVQRVHDSTPMDPRKFMLRMFRGDDGGEGIARAMLSDTYKRIDNLDVLTAALEGVRAADVDVEIEGCDLTERNMLVRIVSPQITANMPVLLDGYRSPFRDETIEAQRAALQRGRELAAHERQGYDPGSEPVVWAGLVLRNSETGGGAFTITPRVSVRVCRNGLTITQDAMRSVHLGSKMDEGVIRWSDDTQTKTLQLITAKARDAVATFLDADYLQTIAQRIEQAAGREIVGNAADAVTVVGKALSFTEQQTQGVLDHFIRGGQTTAAGVVNAITSYAQLVPDADDAAELEAAALRALELVPVRA
jgi:hypothetical protein